VEERSQHRREEKEWLAERTSLSRRLQLLDRLGLDRLQPAGHKTEGRLESRLDQPIQYYGISHLKAGVSENKEGRNIVETVLFANNLILFKSLRLLSIIPM
jgi:hypothetical protein